MRVVAMHVTTHYWAFLFVMGAGSTFSPLGIRIAYTLGKAKYIRLADIKCSQF